DRDPRRVPGLADRVTVVVEVREGDWSAEFGERERADHRVLSPALHPAERALAVGVLPLVVDRVPPGDESRLLQRRDKRAVASGGVDVLEQPADDLPAESLLGQEP